MDNKKDIAFLVVTIIILGIFSYGAFTRYTEIEEEVSIDNTYDQTEINEPEITPTIENIVIDEDVPVDINSSEEFQTEEVSQDDNLEVVATSGTFEDYDESKLVNAETGKVVIFFNASWCPSCKSLKSDIESNLSNIPVGTTILSADYDTYTDLKKKYGVTTQHTLVQVDKDGNQITKWSGGSTLDTVLDKIQ